MFGRATDIHPLYPGDVDSLTALALPFAERPSRCLERSMAGEPFAGKTDQGRKP